VFVTLWTQAFFTRLILFVTHITIILILGEHLDGLKFPLMRNQALIEDYHFTIDLLLLIPKLGRLLHKLVVGVVQHQSDHLRSLSLFAQLSFCTSQSMRNAGVPNKSWRILLLMCRFWINVMVSNNVFSHHTKCVSRLLESCLLLIVLFGFGHSSLRPWSWLHILKFDIFNFNDTKKQ
jgi:hypothetical protein